MQPDPIISSILNRYKNNQPVSPEEKAILHKWLIQSLRNKKTPANHQKTILVTVRKIRKKILIWQYIFIILTLIMVTCILYLLVVKDNKYPIRKADDNLHDSHQKIWKAR